MQAPDQWDSELLLQVLSTLLQQLASIADAAVAAHVTLDSVDKDRVAHDIRTQLEVAADSLVVIRAHIGELYGVAAAAAQSLTARAGADHHVRQSRNPNF